MAKGFGGRGGMGGMPQGFNMNNLMKQAQKMQQQMEKTQQELAEKTFEVSAGGGAVKMTIAGDKKLRSVSINPEVVDADDVEMLEDLILTCVNEAVRQADEYSSAEMAKITGGAPGMGGTGGLF